LKFLDFFYGPDSAVGPLCVCVHKIILNEIMIGVHLECIGRIHIQRLRLFVML